MARSPSRISPEVMSIKPGDQVERRRLAAAGRTDQRHELAVFDLERDAIDGDHIAIGLRSPRAASRPPCSSPFLADRRSCARVVSMVRPSAPGRSRAMSAARRLRLVSSFLALTTHQIAAFRYDGGCRWKKSHAGAFARNCLLAFTVEGYTRPAVRRSRCPIDPRSGASKAASPGGMHQSLLLKLTARV